MKKLCPFLLIILSLMVFAACNSQKSSTLTVWTSDIADFKFQDPVAEVKAMDQKNFYKKFPKAINADEAYYIDTVKNRLGAIVYIFEYGDQDLNKVLDAITATPEGVSPETPVFQKVKVDGNNIFEVANKKATPENVTFATWKSGPFFIYIMDDSNSGIAREILAKYLEIYPSNL